MNNEALKDLAVIRTRLETLQEDSKRTIRRIKCKRKEIAKVASGEHLTYLNTELEELETHFNHLKEEHDKLRTRLYSITSDLWKTTDNQEETK